VSHATSRRTSRWARPIAWVLTLAVSGAVEADPDVARAALEAGKSALSRKDWSTAQTSFQRALEEEPDHHEARAGLADAQMGLGNRAEAATTLRGLLTRMEEATALAPEQVAVYTRGRKRLSEVSPDDAALDLIVRRHADALAVLGGKWTAKEPDVAAAALRAALRIAPDHSKAASSLTKVGAVVARKPMALFNGRDLSGWEGAGPTWTIDAGTILGDVRDAAMILTTSQKFSGDFDVLMEARLVKEYSDRGPPFFAVEAPWVDDKVNSSFGCLRGKLLWRDGAEEEGQGSRDLVDMPFAKVKEGLAPSTWITYELRFRGNQMMALIDGKEVGRAPRPKARDNGRVGLVCQNCKVAIRRVEVTPR
jgi:tetratricopeptide (TPR) repeat protein